VKTVIAAALGECVHVAGVTNFLRLAEAAGWRTVFLGPAVPVEQVLAAELRDRTLDLVMQRDDIFEYYHPETGAPPRKAAPIFGWTSAVFIDLAIKASNGNVI